MVYEAPESASFPKIEQLYTRGIYRYKIESFLIVNYTDSASDSDKYFCK